MMPSQDVLISAIEHISKNLTIREDIKRALDRYAGAHTPTGDFLRAVLENDLRKAVFRADDYNRTTLYQIVGYVYTELPSDCQGSPEKVKNWLSLKTGDVALDEAEYERIDRSTLPEAQISAMNEFEQYDLKIGDLVRVAKNERTMGPQNQNVAGAYGHVVSILCNPLPSRYEIEFSDFTMIVEGRDLIKPTHNRDST